MDEIQIIMNLIIVGICSTLFRWPGFFGSLTGIAIYLFIIKPLFF